MSAMSRPRMPCFSFASTTMEAAFGRFVREGRKLRRVSKLGFADARQRQEFSCLAVAKRDRAGLVEEERVDVACGFDCSA